MGLDFAQAAVSVFRDGHSTGADYFFLIWMVMRVVPSS